MVQSDIQDIALLLIPGPDKSAPIGQKACQRERMPPTAAEQTT